MVSPRDSGPTPGWAVDALVRSCMSCWSITGGTLTVLVLMQYLTLRQQLDDISA
jgi:hypothetical protein